MLFCGRLHAVRHHWILARHSTANTRTLILAILAPLHPHRVWKPRYPTQRLQDFVLDSARWIVVARQLIRQCLFQLCFMLLQYLLGVKSSSLSSAITAAWAHDVGMAAIHPIAFTQHSSRRENRINHDPVRGHADGSLDFGRRHEIHQSRMLDDQRFALPAMLDDFVLGIGCGRW